LNAWQTDGKPSPALDAFIGNISGVTEQVAINSFVANPVEQGKNVTTNLTYTANTATDYFYVGLFKRNSSGGWLQTIVESAGNQFLVPSTGANISNQVALNIPSNTTPSVNLTNGEYYDVYVELWTAGWGAKLGTSLSSKLTIAASGSLGVEKKNIDNGLVFYPNPVSTILSLKNTNGVVVKSLKITNILGETVYYDNQMVNQNAIDVSNLSSGIYILSVNSGDKIQQFKFCKK
jgi:Flp pilus assembly protein TadG